MDDIDVVGGDKLPGIQEVTMVLCSNGAVTMGHLLGYFARVSENTGK